MSCSAAGDPGLLPTVYDCGSDEANQPRDR
jgi:hypothetical protein